MMSHTVAGDDGTDTLPCPDDAWRRVLRTCHVELAASGRGAAHPLTAHAHDAATVWERLGQLRTALTDKNLSAVKLLDIVVALSHDVFAHAAVQALDESVPTTQADAASPVRESDGALAADWPAPPRGLHRVATMEEVVRRASTVDDDDDDDDDAASVASVPDADGLPAFCQSAPSFHTGAAFHAPRTKQSTAVPDSRRDSVDRPFALSRSAVLRTDVDGNDTVNDYTLWQELGRGAAASCTWRSTKWRTTPRRSRSSSG
jgi:hypothetical protein